MYCTAGFCFALLLCSKITHKLYEYYVSLGMFWLRLRKDNCFVCVVDVVVDASLCLGQVLHLLLLLVQ